MKILDVTSEAQGAQYFTRLQPHPTNQFLLCSFGTHTAIYGTDILLKDVPTACFSPDGAKIFGSSDQGVTIYVFDGKTTNKMTTIPMPEIDDRAKSNFKKSIDSLSVCYLASIDQDHLNVLFTKTESDQGCLPTIFRFSEVRQMLILTLCSENGCSKVPFTLSSKQLETLLTLFTFLNGNFMLFQMRPCPIWGVGHLKTAKNLSSMISMGVADLNIQ